MRASDAERDRISDILREALAEGRLTPEEHGERIDRLLRSRTVGELEPLVRDLPDGRYERPRRAPAPESTALQSGPPRFPAGASERLVAVFGGASRRGRWRVRGRTSVIACFGGVEIDLTEAVFEQQEIEVNAAVLFGGVEIAVPENVTVRGAGAGIFGGFDVRAHESPDPGAPVVVVTGLAVFGGVEVKRRKGRRVKNLRDRDREHS
jgi:hypothetical protein